MKKVLIGIFSLFVAGNAFGDTCATSLMPLFTAAQAAKICATFGAGYIGTQANNTYVNARNAAGSANLSIWKADGSDNTVLNAGSGKNVYLSIASTPEVGITNDTITFTGNTGNIVAPTAIAFSPGSATTPSAKLDAAGLTFISSSSGLVYAPYVATPATGLTPVAGTNDFKPFTVMATAAPTNAAIALPASPTDGEVRRLLVTGANPVVVAALGTPSMNMPVTPGPRRYVAPGKSLSNCAYSSAASSWMCTLDILPTPAS